MIFQNNGDVRQLNNKCCFCRLEFINYLVEFNKKAAPTFVKAKNARHKY